MVRCTRAVTNATARCSRRPLARDVKPRNSPSLPFVPLQSFQASTSPTGVAERPEGQAVQRDGAPRRISRPYSASGSEDHQPRLPHLDPTAPARIDYLLGALRTSEPPGHIADRNAHGIEPFRAFASERSRARFPESLPSRCFSQRPPPEIQTCAAASRFCSPLEIGTHRRFFRPLAGRCSLGIMPLQRYSPPWSRSRRINPHVLQQREGRSRQVARDSRALPNQRIGWPLARLPTLMGFQTFPENQNLWSRARHGL